MDHPLPWLKYVEAGDVEDDSVDFDGLKVESVDGDKLGKVNGFVIDSDTGRPYYVVVDSGGWFTSKHFLVPVGHLLLEVEREALVTDLTRDRVKRFPGFNLDEFDKMTEAQLKELNDRTCEACSVTVVAYSPAEPFSTAWDRPDYAYPDWWHANPTLPDRMGESAYQKPVEYGSQESGQRAQRAKSRE